MFWWTIALFVIDMGLMAGILYILAGRRPAFAHPGAEAMQDEKTRSAPAELIERLKKELSSARLIKKELDKKIHSLDSYEDTLKGREKELKDLIMRARKTDGGAPGDDRRKQAEIYRAAIRMAGEGRSVEEIVKNLGILRGEAELISSLKSFNS